MSRKTTHDTEIFKLLSSKTRLSIIELLISSKSDICVKDIANTIGMTHSATSHQLSLLERKGLVECCRDGQTMCYRLTQSDITKVTKKIMRSI